MVVHTYYTDTALLVTLLISEVRVEKLDVLTQSSGFEKVLMRRQTAHFHVMFFLSVIGTVLSLLSNQAAA